MRKGEQWYYLGREREKAKIVSVRKFIKGGSRLNGDGVE
jgi:hypothetical protein